MSIRSPIPISPAQIEEWSARLQRNRTAIEVLALAAALAVFLVSVLPNLADHPPLTDDEAWVMSASFKLAREGVFGSDMFAGFFHADEHYFFNMPGHHFAIAAAFKLLGAGVAQARLVGFAYGVATVVLTYLLARRAGGVPAALLSLGLLLSLRLGMGFDTGLPLSELAANMRYDLAPVPFMLAAALLLLGRPSLLRAAVAGAVCGVAILMQFYGAFIVPVAIAYLWLEAVPRRRRLQLVGALVAASVLVCLPYGLYILNDYSHFKGQAGTIDARADFADPLFYLDNLIDEPNRFIRPVAVPFLFDEVPPGKDIFADDAETVGLEALFRRPSAKLGILVGLPLSLVYLGRRTWREQDRTHRMLFLALAGLLAQYALLESTKFYFYWIPVVPFLCIGIATALCRVLDPRRWTTLPRAALAGIVALSLLIVASEGNAARLGGLRTARAATSYESVTDAVRAQVPPGSRVVGATSLWWGLRGTDYRSYFLFFYLTRTDAGPYRSSISDFLEGFRAEYIVLTRVADTELQNKLSPRDLADWQSFVATRTTKVARLESDVAGPYGYIDIYLVQ